MALAVIAMLTFATIGCNSNSEQALPDEQLTLCQNPRPEICTQIYLPVCALLVSDAASEEKWRSYPSDCSACSDEKVYAYREDACR